MADVQVDELSIKLSSALDTKLISNLKAISDGLSTLKTSLNGLNGQKAISGMQAVGAGIKDLSAALKSVDSKKLGDIANSVSKLSNASDKIGKMFGGTTSQVKETSKAAKELDKTLNSLVNTYVKELGVKGKEGTGAVKSAVSDVIKGAKDGDVFGSMLENFDKALPIIYKYADGLKYVDNQAADTAKSVLEYMKGINSYNKVFLDDQDTGRGLDFSRKRKQMGPAFTSTKPTSGGYMNWHEFIADYNQNSGDVMSEDTDFYQFYDRIMQLKNAEEQYRQSAMASSEVRDAISEELMNLCTKAQEAAKGVTDLGEATKNIGGSESATDTFSNLKTALDSLSEIETVPDMSWLTQLSKALQNLASPEISTAVANMPTVITGISELTHGLAGVTVPDLTDISELIKTVSGLGGKGVSGAVNNLPQLSHYLTSFMGSLEHLPEVPFTAVADIGILAREISKFGSKNATGAVTNLPQMGAAVKQLLNDVASAPPIDPSVAQTIEGLGNLNAQAIKGLIQLSNESEKSAKKVNILSKAFKGVANTGKGFVSTIGKGITALKNLRNHTTNIGQTGFAQLTKSIVMVRTALWGLRRVASGFMDSIGLASDLVEVNNVIDHVFGNYTTRIEEISKSSIQNFGISELTLKKYAGQFQAMGMTMGITGDMVANATNNIANMNSELVKNGKFIYENNGVMADMATTIAEWTADLASFYNIDYAAAAEKAQAIYTGQTRPLRALGIDLTQANLKAWALANGLNADIENMTQAEKAVLRFQYALSASSIAGSDFQNTIGTWSNQVRILKEQFNALKTIIGTGLISALKPFVAAMNSALSGILKFAQNVLNALGKIFGWEVEIAAGGVSMDDSIADLADGLSDVGASGDDAASGTGKAAKALEEYKRQVLSFDELHMLSAPNENNSGGSGGSGGGGGAGGSGGAGGGGTGSAGDVSVAFKRTKALYESEIDSLEGLGEYIAQTLANELDHIPWPTVYEKASGFGTGLAQFINGLFSEDANLFGELGSTIAGAINTALSAKEGFINGLNFTGIGTAIGTGVNNAMTGINWRKALKNAKNWGEGVGNALNAFVKKTDFTKIGTTVANAINTKVALALSLTEKFDFSTFGKKVASSANAFLKKTNWKGVGKTITNALIGAVEFAAEAISGTDFKELGKGIRDALGEFNWPKFTKAGGKLIGGLLKAAVDSIAGLFGDFAKNIGEAFTQGFNDHVKTMTDAGVPLGKAVMDGVGVGIGNVLAKGATWFMDHIVTPFVDGFKAAFVIGSPAKQQDLVDAAGWVGQGILDAIAAKFTGMAEWVKTNILTPISNALGGAEANRTIHMGIGLVKDGWNGFTSWLLGDKNGSDESGEVSTTNKVSNTGTKILEFLTGNKKGTTTTTNTAKLTKADAWKGKGFLTWLTGSKGGKTSTKNTANVTANYGKWGSYKSLVTQNVSGVSVGVSASSFTDNVPQVYKKISNVTATVTAVDFANSAKNNWMYAGGTPGRANGGIFSGGKWHDIAAYAGGVNSAPTGQLFLAREAGPELVGSLGNHTAVLNNDQIVASVSAGVYSAVRSAMSAVNSGGGNQAPIIEVVVKTDTETLYRQVKRGEKTFNGRYSTVATVM